MSIEKELQARSSVCELCGADHKLNAFGVEPLKSETSDNYIWVCETCMIQLQDDSKIDANHWRCLNDSMWSEVPAVKVLAWRMLNQLKSEGWPQDLLDMLYLEDELLEWAKAGLEDENAIKHIDSNGNVLKSGDSVVLIKDLDVKGSSITAKRGTAVRRISLDPDNAEYIEGKVDGQQIVILTQYVKKSN
ncbi:PhnA domain-containing protein [Bacteroidales bacterium]|nr:PhnA domain-containing protein [Bacteroidales bacterium]